MPPDTGPVPVAGEAELDAAIRKAMAVYLKEAVATVLDGKAPAKTLTAAGVDLARWPDDTVWRRAVDRHVRPVVERIYRGAYRATAGRGPAPDGARAWIATLTERLSPQSWPRRVWAAVQRAVIDSQMSQEPQALTEARVRDILRLDAPGQEYRDRTAELRRTAQDTGLSDEERQAAARDLAGRHGRPPDGAGTPWEADAARIAQTEAVASTGSGALDGGRDHGGPGAVKRWHARHDDATRPAHAEADTEELEVPVGQPFIVGGEPLMFPGDPNGSPGNTISCRCEVEIIPGATLAAGAHEETSAMTTTTEEMITAAVTAATDLPFAPRDTPWDGQAAREAVRSWATSNGKLDTAQYARAFLYRPDGAPPSAYQLPFATVRDGKLEAVWKGITAAAAAVQGSRGGVDLSEPAKKDVKTRLTTLYAAAAKAFEDDTIKPPWDSKSMRAALVAAGALETPTPVFDGAVDVWDPALFPDADRPGAETFVKPEWLRGPGTLPTPESIQEEEPFDPDKPRVVVFPDDSIIGYTSTWQACHVGYPGECVTAPRDEPSGPGQLGYQSFHRFPVRIADGALRLGKVTMVTTKDKPGHAVTNANAMRAAAHYDNAASLMAMVRAGEDEHGIWIAGKLLPDVTPSDRIDLALSELSGDWRTVNGVPLQMIASLAVNHGGFLASGDLVTQDGTETTGDGLALAAAAAGDDCGCKKAGDPASGDEEPGPLDEELAALVAAVAVDFEPDEDVLAAVDRDMRTLTAAALPADTDGDPVMTAANWVQQTGTGHLPSYIRRIADHLKEQGMDTSRAIATAVNVVKKACSNPDGLNYPGVQKVTPKTRAQACRAVTEWEAKKAEAKSR